MITIALPSELFAPAQSSHYVGEYPASILEAGPDTYSFAEPLQWSIDVTNTGEAFLVWGRIVGVATCPCARCLEPASFAIDEEVDGYFLIEPDETTEDEIVEHGFYRMAPDHTIDIEPALTGAVLLALPMTPLCREDCKGLCTACGKNLNDGPCGCEGGSEAADVDSDNPFAILKTLVFEEE